MRLLIGILTGLYIGGHSLISLFRTLSTPVLNLIKKLILVEIEFLTLFLQIYYHALSTVHNSTLFESITDYYFSVAGADFINYLTASGLRQFDFCTYGNKVG